MLDEKINATVDQNFDTNNKQHIVVIKKSNFITNNIFNADKRFKQSNNKTAEVKIFDTKKINN